MADSDSDEDIRRSEGGRRRAEIGSHADATTTRGDIDVVKKPTLHEVRSTRSHLYTGGRPGRKRTAAAPKMATSRSAVTASKPLSSHRHSKTRSSRHRSDSEAKPRHRAKSSSTEEDRDEVYVYRPPRTKARSSTVRVAEKETVNDDDDSDDRDGVMSVISEEPSGHEKKVKYVYVRTDKPKSSVQNSRRRSAGDVKLDKGDNVVPVKRHSSVSTSRRASSSQPFDFLKRSLSLREDRSSLKPTPLKRSHSTSRTQVPAKASYEGSITSAKTTKKHQGLLGGLFSSAPKHREPPRLVECLVCMSDDIPYNKSAKLKCGHRMCHSCLKRIFKLSVNDPQHMPPKCCTSDHIPLKHVDKLFDVPFKKLWNKKYQEFTTRNRIYCPSKRCGEWIKPANIHDAEGGRKYGRCSRCKTKVCCLCNAKWHGNKDCPKDEETNRLLEAAKTAGWQRCYNCRTMIELKEGCNHMTCRCNAEFCMICGVKWKSCNCPWFNYEQVENDRLNHMRIPGDFPPPLNIFRPPRPRGYREEIDARRRQEQLDEDIARRFQMLGLDIADDDDFDGIVGLGNARPHLMNENFRRPNVVRERVAPPPPPPPPPALRPRDAAAEAYNAARTTRPEERVVPRRTRTDYAGEAATHAPAPRRNRARAPPPAPRPSDLAGLGGAGRGSGRVHQWRTHVMPGIEPAEGVLSM